jgi:hypothetical protein
MLVLWPDFVSCRRDANILNVRNTTKLRVLEFLRPLILGLGFVFKVVFSALFGWWLAPWLRYKANRELVNDIERQLSFLISGRNAIRVLHTEWPTAEILSGNLLFTILRWRDETSVSVAPRHFPTQSYQLGSLDDAAKLLRTRLEDLNVAFSEQEFSRETRFYPPTFLRSSPRSRGFE